MFFPEFPANHLRNLLSQKLNIKLEKLKLQALSSIDLIPQKANSKPKPSNLHIKQSSKYNLKPTQSLPNNKKSLRSKINLGEKDLKSDNLLTNNLKSNPIKPNVNQKKITNNLVNQKKEFIPPNKDYYSNISSNNKTRLVQFTKLTANQMSQFDFPVKGTLEGQVLKPSTNNLLPVTINEKTVVAENPQNYQFKVGQTVSIKIQNTNAHFKFVVPEQTSQGSFESQPANVKIADILPKLNREINSFKNKILSNPIFNKEVLEPKVLDKILKTLQLFKPTDPTVFKGEEIQKTINQSGVNYEAKIKELMFENTQNKVLESIRNDLKGQLLDLQKRIESLISKEQLPEFNLSKLREFQTHIRQSLQGIEQQQLNQFISKQESQSFLLPFLDNLMGENEKFKIFVRPDQQEGETEKSDQKEFSLVFLLELTNLGNLRIDSKLKSEQVDIKITGEGLDIVEFIDSQILDFTNQMQQKGFNISVSTSVQNKLVFNFPEDHEEINFSDVNRLVDIMT